MKDGLKFKNMKQIKALLFTLLIFGCTANAPKPELVKEYQVQGYWFHMAPSLPLKLKIEEDIATLSTPEGAIHNFDYSGSWQYLGEDFEDKYAISMGINAQVAIKLGDEYYIVATSFESSETFMEVTKLPCEKNCYSILYRMNNAFVND